MNSTLVSPFSPSRKNNRSAEDFAKKPQELKKQEQKIEEIFIQNLSSQENNKENISFLANKKESICLQEKQEGTVTAKTSITYKEFNPELPFIHPFNSRTLWDPLPPNNWSPLHQFPLGNLFSPPQVKEGIVTVIQDKRALLALLREVEKKPYPFNLESTLHNIPTLGLTLFLIQDNENKYTFRFIPICKEVLETGGAELQIIQSKKAKKMALLSQLSPNMYKSLWSNTVCQKNLQELLAKEIIDAKEYQIIQARLMAHANKA